MVNRVKAITWTHDDPTVPYASQGLSVFNSLAPGGLDYSLKLVNFKLISTIDILSIFCEIAIRWKPQHLNGH